MLDTELVDAVTICEVLCNLVEAAGEVELLMKAGQARWYKMVGIPNSPAMKTYKTCMMCKIL